MYGFISLKSSILELCRSGRPDLGLINLSLAGGYPKTAAKLINRYSENTDHAKWLWWNYKTAKNI